MKRARTAKRMQTTIAATAGAGKTGVQTITVPVSAPRNPYVSLARRRKAGAHGDNARTRRQAEKRELRGKLLEE